MSKVPFFFALKYFRVSRNLSVRELACHSGLTKNTIWRYEKGVRDPSPYSLSQILLALNIDEKDFSQHVVLTRYFCCDPDIIGVIHARIFSFDESDEPVPLSRASVKQGLCKKGNQNKRDRMYPEFEDKNFRNWWHRKGKQQFGQGQDISSKKMAEEMYNEWDRLGRPVVKFILPQ